MKIQKGRLNTMKNLTEEDQNLQNFLLYQNWPQTLDVLQTDFEKCTALEEERKNILNH